MRPDAIERRTPGQPVGEDFSYDAPPKDTGEAMDLSAAHPTVTVGFGRTLFVDDDGRDRFGLRELLPPALITMSHFLSVAMRFSHRVSLSTAVNTRAPATMALILEGERVT